MQFGRLVGLRLTEIEVHHADLAIGFGPRDWSSELTQTCLPLRVASLARFRRRPDADRTIDGSWLLVCDDLGRQWRVEAHDSDVEIDDTATNADADTVLRGSATDLTALLLGRQGPSMLAVSGDATLARRSSGPFPGPERRGAQNMLGFANLSRTSGSKCSSGSVSYAGSNAIWSHSSAKRSANANDG